MSEAELHLLRSRLTEGLRSKAARGELRLNLPAGLDYDDDDHVIIAPDQAVAEAITTVFRRFSELGSARQVVVSLRADELLLPRRNLRTGKIVWAEAGYPAVHDILTHPAYAGDRSAMAAPGPRSTWGPTGRSLPGNAGCPGRSGR